MGHLVQVLQRPQLSSTRNCGPEGRVSLTKHPGAIRGVLLHPTDNSYAVVCSVSYCSLDDLAMRHWRKRSNVPRLARYRYAKHLLKSRSCCVSHADFARVPAPLLQLYCVELHRLRRPQSQANTAESRHLTKTTLEMHISTQSTF